MSSVDDRIVNMQFSNKQFESGVSQSTKTLKGLEQTLAKTGQTNGLNDLGKSADNVKLRFTALQVAGVAAVTNITNQAISSATSFIKSFSGIRSAMDGFEEYELKLGSIQTIMANTGAKLPKVNKYLNELNEYSDQTIYNFADMTKNIGLFTNAGIKLKAATGMIKGFSNEAAVSGTNSAQAAGAAYQLSQALSAGTIRLMDWRSLQNVGMGNKKMQGNLIEIAMAMGKLKKGTETANLAQKDFNGSLEKKWLTADVMEQYLTIMSDGEKKTNVERMRGLGLSEKQIKNFVKQQRVAQNAATKVRTWTALVGTVREQLGSGWAASMELIIGDFKQATKLWTNVNDAIGPIIGAMTKSRNEMLKGWADGGGRSAIITSLGRIATSIGSILMAVGKAWRQAFPKSNENSLLNFSLGFEKLTRAIVPSEAMLTNITKVFSGLFGVISVGWAVVKGVFGAIRGFISGISEATASSNASMLAIYGFIGNLVSKLTDLAKKGSVIEDAMTAVGTAVGTVVGTVMKAISLVLSGFAALARGEGIAGFMKPFNDARQVVADFGSDFMGKMAELTAPLSVVSGWFQYLKSKIDGARESMSEASAEVGKIGSAFDTGTKGLLGFASGTGDKLSSAMDKVRGNTDNAKSSVTDFYKEVRGSGSASAASSLDVVSASAEDAGSKWFSISGTLSAIGSGIKAVFSGIGKAVGWVTKQFSDLFGGYDGLEWASMINAIFTGAMILSFRDMAKSFTGIFDSIPGVLDGVTSTLSAMQQSIKAEAIRNIAIAIGILALALIALSFVDPVSIAASLGAIAGMVAILTAAMVGLNKLVSDNEETSRWFESTGIRLNLMSSAIFILAAALVLLALAVAIFGAQDMDSLTKGLSGLAITLALMLGTVFAFNKMEGEVNQFSKTIMVLAFALTVLALAVLAFGSMNPATMIQGLMGIAVVLALLIGTIFAFSKMDKVAEKAAVTITALAFAMLALAAAVTAFGLLPMDVLIQGMIAMAAGLLILVGALIIVSQFAGSASASALAIIAIAIALNMLLPVIITLGTLPWEVVVVGLIAMAAALLVLVGAGYLAMMVMPGLLALAALVAALGIALALAGVGMALFGTGFALLAATGVAGVAVLVAAFQAFMALLPTLAVQIGAAFVAFLDTLAAMAPKVRKSLGKIFKAMIGVITDAIPEIEELFKQLITSAINVIEDAVPKFVEMGFTIIDEFLKSAEEHVPSIVDSAISLVTKFLDAIGDGLPRLAESGANLVIDFINAVADTIENKSDEMRAAMRNLAGAMIDGLTGGLGSAALKKAKGAIGDIANGMKNKFKSVFDINSPSKVMFVFGHNIVEGLVAGIRDKTTEAIRAITSLAKDAISAGNDVVAKAYQKSFGSQALSYKANATLAIADANVEKYGTRSSKADAKVEKSESRISKLEADKKKTKDKKKKAEIQKEIDKEKKLLASRKKTAAAAEKQEQAAIKRQEKASKKADARQVVYEEDQRRAEWTREFEGADTERRSELHREEGNLMRDRALEAEQQRKAQFEEALRLMREGRYAEAARMTQRAMKSAQDAARYAEESKKHFDSALALDEDLRKENEALVRDRIRKIIAEKDADRKAREDAAAYEAADNEGKIKIMEARAEASAKRSEEAQAESDKYIEMAEALAPEDAEKAMAFLDLAEEKARQAREDFDRAKQESDQAKSLRNESTPGSNSGPPVITPSRSILDDAANAMDRYTLSLEQSEMLAMAGMGTTVQYVQNIHAPEALTPSTIYRQTKNLVSTQANGLG